MQEGSNKRYSVRARGRAAGRGRLLLLHLHQPPEGKCGDDGYGQGWHAMAGHDTRHDKKIPK